MADELLRSLIGNRRVQDMKYSEAAKLVGEFYLRITLLTLGSRNPRKVDYMVDKALQKAGLGCFC